MFFSLQEIVKQELILLDGEHSEILRWVTSVSRILIPVVSVFILSRIAYSLFKSKQVPECWGYFNLANGLHIPISHWENLIGRARNCDVIMNFPTVSRNHAILMRQEDERWLLIDLASKTGISFMDKKVKDSVVIDYGDVITIGGIEAQLVGLTLEEKQRQEAREVPGREVNPALTMYLLTVLNILLGAQLCFAHPANFTFLIPFGFLIAIVIFWGYSILMKILRRSGFEIEQLAFYLTSIGLSVVTGSLANGAAVTVVTKTLLAFVIGLLMFLVLGWLLRDLKRANSMRWPMAVLALGLLLFSIVAGRVVNGAKNWVYIGGFSIQPSEFAKLCFVYAGTATLDRLFAKRNLLMYMILTVAIAGALAYTSDFGAAIIFFMCFLIVAFMRSGDIATISLIILAAFVGGLLLIRFKPYIAYRFSSWRHAWDLPHDGGFQQARTMSAAASGGLFGVGAGRGWLRNIVAADTDLVFGVVVEELGLIVGICCIISLLILLIFSVRSATHGRSTFYIIAATAAMSMLVFQMILNVLGSLDILPLTGVTFPFISNGGSSLLVCYSMLAFPKAADTRRLASFATRREFFYIPQRRKTV